jgi:hypothetical protein
MRIYRGPRCIDDQYQLSRSMIRFLFILLMVTLVPCLAFAKRMAPAKVEPVTHTGIRYVAPNDDGRHAYIEAWDVQTNKKLWDLTVFTNPVDPKVEEDVQWIFIKSLSIEGDRIVVTSERGNTYQIDLSSRAVTQLGTASSPGLDAAVHSQDIPESVKRVIADGSFAKDYDVSFHLNPFYLCGDFDRDGKTDVAVLIKQRSTGKLGIAIVHGVTNKVTILGAGTGIGNGGDDFEWMDSWGIYPNNRVAGGTKTPKLHGDALLVSKSEAASALIYWNGKRYVWLQRGN